MEKNFNGFPRNSESIPVPSPFFTFVMPDIQEINELKIALQVFWLLAHKKGIPRFTTVEELTRCRYFTRGLKNSEASIPGPENIKLALDSLVKKNVLLTAKLKNADKTKDLFFLNMEPDRTYLNKILTGELNIPDLSLQRVENEDSELVDNIYSVYEKNIGIITPMIAEEIKKAEETYPADWITDAIKEAVNNNKRNWRYITAILERWTTEGRSNGEAGRHTKKERDRDRFIKGKYGHLVNR